MAGVTVIVPCVALTFSVVLGLWEPKVEVMVEIVALLVETGDIRPLALIVTLLSEDDHALLGAEVRS